MTQNLGGNKVQPRFDVVVFHSYVNGKTESKEYPASGGNIAALVEAFECVGAPAWVVGRTAHIFIPVEYVA